jgi:4-diphosphocytidyl-2-C-methyl-D-erythritol kinase
MVVFPNAKINLGLFITQKRADGFHDLESVFLPVSLRDVLEFIPNGMAEGRLFASGIRIDGSPDCNLVMRAISLLRQDFTIPGLDVYLHKSIPSGAGLGGGSSDGGFALTGLNRMFSLGLAVEKLEDLAARLGSDCPFFVANRPSFVCGRGEISESLAIYLNGFRVLLVKPDLHISTADAFRDIHPRPASFDLRTIAELPVSEWKHHVRNDFEEGIFARFPVLADIKQRHYDNGAVYAQMSGTGSCVYGIYRGVPDTRPFSSDWFVYDSEVI